MFLSLPFLGSNALNIPPFVTRSADSCLMPRVAHIELLAASSGSSILRVLGIHTPLSCLPSPVGLPSLECFPNVGELFPDEQPPLLVDEEGDKPAPDPIQGTFHAPPAQPGGTHPQYDAATNGNGTVGVQKAGAVTNGGGFHWTEPGLLLSGLKTNSEEHRPAAMAAMLLQPGLQGYGHGGGTG